jgi:hypothetical protein
MGGPLLRMRKNEREWRGIQTPRVVTRSSDCRLFREIVKQRVFPRGAARERRATTFNAETAGRAEQKPIFPAGSAISALIVVAA